MGSVNGARNMNAGVVYAPYIPILQTDPEAEYRFKVELCILKFKVMERSSEWANKSTQSNN